MPGAVVGVLVGVLTVFSAGFAAGVVVTAGSVGAPVPGGRDAALVDRSAVPTLDEAARDPPSDPATAPAHERRALPEPADPGLVEALRARIRALQDGAAGPRSLPSADRLAPGRAREWSRLRDALATGSLRYARNYTELADFVVAPDLIAERPAEFVTCLERLALASGVVEAEPTESGTRSTSLEDAGLGARIGYEHFAAAPSGRSGVRVEVCMPSSLPLGHPSHLRYRLYAEFTASGRLALASFGRENGTKASLQAGPDGRLSGSPSVTRALDDAGRARTFGSIEACALRLASLSPPR